MTRQFTLAATLTLLGLAIPQAHSADMPAMGPWNAGAAQTAEGSRLAQSAMAMIKGEIAHIADENLRNATQDAVFHADTCIRHRAQNHDGLICAGRGQMPARTGQASAFGPPEGQDTAPFPDRQ